MIDGGGLSVMGSYNRLNGTYACHSRRLLTETLKDGWGWPGFIAPDFMFAVRDDLAAANAGLDVAALDGPGNRTADDFASGRIPQDRLDDMVRRILYGMVAGGLVDEPLAERPPGPLSSPRARRGGEAGSGGRHGAAPQSRRVAAACGTARCGRSP